MATVSEVITKWLIRVDDKQLKRFQKDFKAARTDITAGLGGLTRTVRNIGLAFGAATAGVGIFVKAAGDFEQVTVAFETMLGSAERANKLLQEITTFAAKTPFQLTGLLRSSKSLLAFGFAAEEIIPTLQSLGNIAAGVGTERLPQLILALGQVRAATRLRGQELRQFTEAGVPVLDILAQRFGKSAAEVQELVSQGKVGFDDLNAALKDLTTGNGRFANLMAKQSKTFLGLVSNIIDVFEILAIQIGDQVLPVAKEFAEEILNFVEVNRELIKIEADKFFRELVILVKDGAKFFLALGKIIKSVTDAFGGFARSAKFILGGLFVIQLGLVIGSFARMAVAIGQLIIATRTLGTAGLVANIKFLSGILAIGAGLVALLLFFEDINGFLEGNNSLLGLFLDSLDEVFPMIGKIRNAIVDFLSDVGAGLISFFRGEISLSELLSQAEVQPATGAAAGVAAAAAMGTNQANINAPVTITIPPTLGAGAAAAAVQAGMREAMESTFREAELAIETPVER